jgi:hypothetical protein
MAESVGSFNRLFISAGESDATYTEIEFLEGSGIGLSEQFPDSDGIVGSRSRPSERTRRGIRQATGSLNLTPTPDELDIILVWAAGGAKSGNEIDLAENLPARWLKTYRDNVGWHVYNGVKVGSMTLSCSEGSMLGLTIQLVGVDEAESVAPTSPAAIDLDAGPYMIHDCALSVGGDEYQFRNFQLTIDNMVETRHNNSVTPTSVRAINRRVSLALGMPHGEAHALYDSPVTGAEVSADFINGNRSLTIVLPAVQAPRQPMPFGARSQATLSWGGIARKAGSTPEVTFFNDVTG